MSFSPSFGTWSELLSHATVWGAFGLHPHHAKYYTDDMELKIRECLKHPRAIAWGETGLDFFKNNSPREAQITAFSRQIIAAVELGKPLVVHSRDAARETIDTLGLLLSDSLPI
jgi:TatD DNase family protein